jgi:membrane protein
LREVVAHARKTRTLGLAAESAFWLFLGLVPLAAVAGLVAARTTASNWAVLAPVVGALPVTTRELVTAELFTIARWNGGTVGATSAALFLWFGSSGVQALFEGLEIETASTRPWGTRRALSILSCVVLSLLVAAIGLLATGVQTWLTRLAELVPSLEPFAAWDAPEGPLRRAITWTATFGYVCGLYWVGVPADTRRRLPLLPGAAMAMGLAVALTSGYGFYLKRTTNGAMYGASLAIIGLTLMWLYLLSVSILAGAVFNHALATTLGRRSDEPRA